MISASNLRSTLIVSLVSYAIGQVAIAEQIVVASVKPAEAESGFNTAFGLTRQDADKIAASFGEDALMMVRIRAMRQTARHSARELDVQVVGAEATLWNVDNLPAVRGRFLSDEDLQRRSSAAVIDAGLARRLFETTDAIGRTLRLGEQYFLVVGVLEDRPDAQRAANKLRVFIPLTTMRVRYGDTVVRQEAGSFRVERYELSEIRVALAKKVRGLVAKGIVEQVLRGSHEVKDYNVRIIK